MTLESGSRIHTYIINTMLARGGMGVVWDAWDDARNQAVAIKAVANDLMRNPEFKVRMQDEARRHQSLVHPNIVPVLEVFETGSETCIVMKRIDGISLKTHLSAVESNRLPIPEAIRIQKDILRALDYAHQRGIVHRDVKPSNVLLEEGHRAMLIDFGIALAAGEERRTRTGQIVGTPMYMSPEQILYPLKLDHRSDVYNAGCVLYEMLTGRPPFMRGEEGVGDTDFEVQQAHVHMPAVHPKRRNPDLSDDLGSIIMTALEKKPDDRIPGCGEFVRLLENLDHEPGGGEGGQTEAVGQKPRRRWLLIIGVLLVLFLIFLLFFNL